MNKVKAIGAAVLCCVMFVCAVCLFGCNSDVSNEMLKASYPREYKELVEKYAKENDVEEAFVYAVIKSESSFNPDSMSEAGAIGLMQLMPDTIDFAMMHHGITEYYLDNFYDPEKNIMAGTYILGYLQTIYKDKATIAAAYNAGWGNVDSWLQNSEYSDDGVTLKKIPFVETENYVKKVMGNYEKYKQLYY